MTSRLRTLRIPLHWSLQTYWPSFIERFVVTQRCNLTSNFSYESSSVRGKLPKLTINLDKQFTSTQVPSTSC